MEPDKLIRLQAVQFAIGTPYGDVPTLIERAQAIYDFVTASPLMGQVAPPFADDAQKTAEAA